MRTGPSVVDESTRVDVTWRFIMPLKDIVAAELYLYSDAEIEKGGGYLHPYPCGYRELRFVPIVYRVISGRPWISRRTVRLFSEGTVGLTADATHNIGARTPEPARKTGRRALIHHAS